MECVCTSSDLFCFGCRCGYHANSRLRVLFNGKDFVVARNSYHAAFILEEEHVEASNEPWRVIADDEQLTFSIGSPEGESLTAEEWVNVLGEGYAVAAG